MRLMGVITISVLMLLSGCSGYTGSKDIKMQLQSIQQQLNSEDWDTLNAQMNEFVKIYNKNEWKLQLLGDEGEYERLHESINRLVSAIQFKGLEEARLELATLLSIVDDIYSL